MSSKTPLNSLPNELLLAMLNDLPTRELLPFTALNHHFSSIALRIFHQRLQNLATSLSSSGRNKVILECYHPTAKISTPYLYCDYLLTDTFYDESSDSALRNTLGDVYTHFRPVLQEENRRPRARYPRRSPQQRPADDEEKTVPHQDIYLDADEPFSQLCVITNLVKLGPKLGLFLSHVNISEGLVRLKRNFLSAAASNKSSQSEMLWADAKQTIGLRFSIEEKDMGVERPVLVAEEEELPVAYRLQFEELVVRTGELLEAFEKAEKQEGEIDGAGREGRAVVIASF
ncbi:hypothetical protein QBC40DRAFT_226733 [Triangularia verruculosa]|uniref:F-box domain-containing protein n=1 Tax=Triangularia verruculosa TaxID=2587418 RepID=A0AAN6XI42_9PEZI|nr:hypothetical protein QBC40DRAFT_226733 [Triangularia verruculosa]